ncbi:MAG: HD domain-containing protein [Bacilli bacterium]|nr:HD domain-containing protein [Bacilli bacterium]
MKLIAELNDGERVVGQFLVGSAAKGTNAMGSQYYSLELRDSSGSINAKKWEVGPDDETIFVSGNVINIVGEVLKYKDALQIKLVSASLVPSSEIDTNRFLKQPPVSKEELINKFNYYVDSIKNPDCKAILDYCIKKIGPKLYDHPAAVSIHHDYLSGLLVHTLTMADIAVKLAPIYEADYDILMTGILMHDMGKTIELEGPAIFHYSLEGKLLGHISIMSAMIKEASEKLNITSEVGILLQHMILSHHGQQEYGSPVLPLTREALLLSLIDNLDCKMVALNKALETTNSGEFTNKIFSLDNRSVYKPKN